MSTPNDGGPAFPIVTRPRIDCGDGRVYEQEHETGMSLRDYFAAKALPAIIADCTHIYPTGFPTTEDFGGDQSEENCYAIVAADAYAMADAMIVAKDGVHTDRANVISLVEICERWVDQSDGIMHKGCPVGQLVQDTKEAIAAAKGGAS